MLLGLYRQVCRFLVSGSQGVCVRAKYFFLSSSLSIEYASVNGVEGIIDS